MFYIYTACLYNLQFVNVKKKIWLSHKLTIAVQMNINCVSTHIETAMFCLHCSCPFTNFLIHLHQEVFLHNHTCRASMLGVPTLLVATKCITVWHLLRIKHHHRTSSIENFTPSPFITAFPHSTIHLVSLITVIQFTWNHEDHSFRLSLLLLILINLNT